MDEEDFAAMFGQPIWTPFHQLKMIAETADSTLDVDVKAALKAVVNSIAQDIINQYNCKTDAENVVGLHTSH